jgi:tetratricopeptide (TPR) repeat protein
VVTIDPLSLVSNMTPVIVWTHSGRFDKAADAAAKALKLDPGNPIPTWLYVSSLFHAERYSEAFALLDRAELDPQHPFSRMSFALSAAIQRDEAETRRILDEDLLTVMRVDPQYSLWVAEIYALIGDHDTAIDGLGHSVARGFVPYRYLTEFDPLLKDLRDDPRFQYITARAKVASDAFEV